MDDFLTFITARLDEEETAAAPFERTTWTEEPPAVGVVLVDGEPHIEGHLVGLTAHIALHDPARELRSIAADRALVAKAAGQPGYRLPEGQADERTEEERRTDDVIRLALYEFLRDRATRWADHADYRAKDWSPEGRMRWTT